MTHIWKYIDAKEWTERGKFRFTLWLFGFIFAITGFVIWLINIITAVTNKCNL